MLENEHIKISIIGLGYVGLPLAIEFAKHFDVVGFDISPTRVEQLSSFTDRTKQVNRYQLENSGVMFTSDVGRIADSSVYIITVPTPIDNNKQPDLSALLSASETVASVLKQDDIVIYESTVYRVVPKRSACRYWKEPAD